MTVSEMLEAMQENDLFDKFSEFPYVVHIHAVFCRTIIQCVERRYFERKCSHFELQWLALGLWRKLTLETSRVERSRDSSTSC
ncbi:hypothetical protein ACROYT_G020785 [Oculina patagonica]